HCVAWPGFAGRNIQRVRALGYVHDSRSRGESMSKLRLFCGAIALSALSTSSPMAQAQETLKIAAGQRGNWDTTIAEVGQRGGIFKKPGLTLEILYTQGGGEPQRAEISGGATRG